MNDQITKQAEKMFQAASDMKLPKDVKAAAMEHILLETQQAKVYLPRAALQAWGSVVLVMEALSAFLVRLTALVLETAYRASVLVVAPVLLEPAGPVVMG